MAEKTRRYTTISGNVYSQTIVTDEKTGKIIFDNWRKGNKILQDASYISEQRCSLIAIQSLEDIKEIMKMAKEENYHGNNGLIIHVYKDRLYHSSSVKKIEPPFEGLEKKADEGEIKLAPVENETPKSSVLEERTILKQMNKDRKN